MIDGKVTHCLFPAVCHAFPQIRVEELDILFMTVRSGFGVAVGKGHEGGVCRRRVRSARARARVSNDTPQASQLGGSTLCSPARGFQHRVSKGVPGVLTHHASNSLTYTMTKYTPRSPTRIHSWAVANEIAS